MAEAYYAKRIGQAVATIYVVITLSFVLIRLLPGGPQDYLRAQLIRNNPQAGTTEIQQLVESYTNVNPTKPIYLQYVDYMSSILTGDFGKSVWYQEPVIEILIQALPWTVLIMSLALLISYVIGIAFGGIMAYNEGSSLDSISTISFITLSSIPYYIAAIVLLVIFSFRLEWLPTSHAYDPAVTPGPNLAFLLSVAKHAILPVVSAVTIGVGGVALQMRSNAISVLGDDYIRVAQLRGLSSRRIALRYLTRNAILPMYTGLLIGIGSMFGGSVILEQIFAYPGVGYYMFQGVLARDYPLVMAGFILITTAVVIGILIADLTYSRIDPRVGGGDSRESY